MLYPVKYGIIDTVPAWGQKNTTNAFRGKDELMRKAKTAAVIFGGVATCLFGGILAVYATAPVVSTAGPENSVEIYDVKNEEFANSAAFTSIRTTAVTTSSKVTTTTKTTFVKADNYYNALTVNKVTSTAPAETTMAATEPVIMTTTVAYIEPTINNEAVQTPAAAPAYEETVNDYTNTDNSNASIVSAEPATEAPAEQPAPAAPVVEEAPASVEESSGLPISDSDYILLCNAVAHEAGSYWISETEKAYVVEVIMNRVNDARYPNTIAGVITQPYQFSGSSSYAYLGTYSGSVTDAVKNAVTYYFNNTGLFTQGYLSFTGDGYRNYFN